MEHTIGVTKADEVDEVEDDEVEDEVETSIHRHPDSHDRYLLNLQEVHMIGNIQIYLVEEIT